MRNKKTEKTKKTKKSKQKIKNRKKPNLKISKIIKNEIAKTKKSAAEKKLF